MAAGDQLIALFILRSLLCSGSAAMPIPGGRPSTSSSVWFYSRQVAAALPSLGRLTQLSYTRGFPVGGPGWERTLLGATSGLSCLRSLQLAAVPNRGGAFG